MFFFTQYVLGARQCFSQDSWGILLTKI